MDLPVYPEYYEQLRYQFGYQTVSERTGILVLVYT